MFLAGLTEGAVRLSKRASTKEELQKLLDIHSIIGLVAVDAKTVHPTSGSIHISGITTPGTLPFKLEVPPGSNASKLYINVPSLTSLKGIGESEQGGWYLTFGATGVKCRL